MGSSSWLPGLIFAFRLIAGRNVRSRSAISFRSPCSWGTPAFPWRSGPWFLRHRLCLPTGSAVPASPDLTDIPAIYHDLGQVFRKARATSPPPHKHYDCAINLLPGTSPPKDHLYSLSEPERKAMDDYIRSSLAAGIIRPSSSPAWSGFFLIE